jgi:hypothetical protein
MQPLLMKKKLPNALNANLCVEERPISCFSLLTRKRPHPLSFQLSAFSFELRAAFM